MTDIQFWQAVYLEAIRAGKADPLSEADRALRALRELALCRA
jgi:hypothetical protein